MWLWFIQVTRGLTRSLTLLSMMTVCVLQVSCDTGAEVQLAGNYKIARIHSGSYDLVRVDRQTGAKEVIVGPSISRIGLGEGLIVGRVSPAPQGAEFESDSSGYFALRVSDGRLIQGLREVDLAATVIELGAANPPSLVTVDGNLRSKLRL
jgi:hypothetical protein